MTGIIAFDECYVNTVSHRHLQACVLAVSGSSNDDALPQVIVEDIAIGRLIPMGVDPGCGPCKLLRAVARY